jgi:hypothetical protein
MTLLTMVQDACALISLPAPNTVVSNSDNAVRILLAAVQREAKELARGWTWQRLQRTATFNTVAQAVQTSSLPADFDGRLLANTFWNNSRNWGIEGPLDPQEWQRRIRSVGQGPYTAWRLAGNAIELAPVPIAGETCSFAYITKNVCASAAGAEQATWTNDSDVGLLDEELMLLGLIWRFKQSRGMDYAEDMQTYQMQVTQAMSRDGSRRTVSLMGDLDWQSPRYPAGVVIGIAGSGGGGFGLDEGGLD